MHAQGKVQAQKRSKTLSLHFKLILGRETAYNIKKKKKNQNKTNKNSANLVKGGQSNF